MYEEDPAEAEIPLIGGNVGGAIRVGKTVRRPSGAWTPMVHDVLRFLKNAGLRGVPEVLGIDSKGREVLTFLPGRSIKVEEEVASEELLKQAIIWLRSYHDVIEQFRPDGIVQWRGEARALGPGEIICHHDFGAYNWVVRDDEFIGAIDWDMCGPGTRLDDLAFTAWNSLPLYREIPMPLVVRRLHTMAAAYGEFSALQILDHVVARLTRAGNRIAKGQRDGDPGMLQLAEAGEPQAMFQALEVLITRIPSIQRALTIGSEPT